MPNCADAETEIAAAILRGTCIFRNPRVNIREKQMIANTAEQLIINPMSNILIGIAVNMTVIASASDESGSRRCPPTRVNNPVSHMTTARTTDGVKPTKIIYNSKMTDVTAHRTHPGQRLSKNKTAAAINPICKPETAKI